VEHLKHVPPHMKLVVTLLESYLRGTPYAHFDMTTGQGYWINAVVRLTQKGKTMLLLNFFPQELSPSDIATLKSGLVAHWSRGPGSQASLASLYLATKSRAGPGNLELVFGSEVLNEFLPNSGLQMRISPQGYFCINTTGASLLVETVVRLAAVTKDDTLLDICCGSGMLGLGLAKRCGTVVGVDVRGDLIEEARRNAEINRIPNTIFFAGKVEEMLPEILAKTTQGRRLVAILDPPRQPLPVQAVQGLRASRVERIVFVASDFRASLKLLVEMSRSGPDLQGDPFLPLLVQPLDLYPHTTHYVCVVLMARVSSQDLMYPHRANMGAYLGDIMDTGRQEHGPSDTKFADYNQGRGQGQGQSRGPGPGWGQQAKQHTPAKEKGPDPREQNLSPEQVQWLQQMVDMYGASFSRAEWVDKFIRDNHEAALKAQASRGPPPPSSNPPPPAPAAPARPPSPEIPPMPPFPVAPKSQDPEEYARYKANYDAYSSWYNQYGAAYAAKQEKKSKAAQQAQQQQASGSAGAGAGGQGPDKLPDPDAVPPGTDPAAWRKYCQDTKEYYARYR